MGTQSELLLPAEITWGSFKILAPRSHPVDADVIGLKWVLRYFKVPLVILIAAKVEISPKPQL